MKNINYKKIISLILLFVVLIIYSMSIRNIFGDEIWEYGYGYNISKGLVPYRDFNMLATPFFPFCVALFIKIFGPYLLSAHIFNAIILIAMIAMMYKIIGNKTLIIIPVLLYSKFNILPTYNGLITFLMVLLVYVKQTDITDKNKIILSGLIVSLMVLTKQSIGAVFFILELFLTKDKKKFLLTFSIPIIIFIIYLIINKALYSFIDYSILGMIEFGNKNNKFSIWFIIFMIMCMYLIILYKKYHNNNILYGLAFMSLCVPIFEEIHTLPSIIVFLLIIFQYINIKKYMIKYITFYMCSILIFCLSFSSIKVSLNKNYLYGRNVWNNNHIKYIEEFSNDLNDLEKEYDRIFIFNGFRTYLIKLYRNERIDKYDMILNGNMGYNGTQKYIKEIDDYCKKHKCLFMEDYNENIPKNQVNKKIINYVRKNYKYKGKSNYHLDNMYTNYYSN